MERVWVVRLIHNVYAYNVKPGTVVTNGRTTRATKQI
jgi:hypothetical protein